MRPASCTLLKPALPSSLLSRLLSRLLLLLLLLHGLGGHGRHPYAAASEAADCSTLNVTIDGPPSLAVRRAQALQFQVQLSRPTSCVLPAGAAQRYRWTVTHASSGTPVYVGSQHNYYSSYFIPGGTLSMGALWRVGVEVWLEAAAGGSSVPLVGAPAPGTASVLVNVVRSAVQARLAGGALRTLESTAALLLDGSSSYDPDDRTAKGQGRLSYEWDAWQLGADGGRLPSSSEQQLPGVSEWGARWGSTVSLNEPAHYAPPPGIAPSGVRLQWPALGRWVIQLTVRNGAHSGVAVMQLQVTAAAPRPPPSISAPAGKVAPDAQLVISSGDVFLSPVVQASRQLLWTVLLGDGGGQTPLPLSRRVSTTSPLLRLPAYTLRPGSYTFRLQVTDHRGATGVAQAGVVVNDAPHGGQLHVQPPSGVAVETRFRLATRGWADADTPLQYRFARRGAATSGAACGGDTSMAEARQLLTRYDFSHQVSMPLGAGASCSGSSANNSGLVTLEVDVRDAFGAVGHASAPARVRAWVPPPGTSLSAATASLLSSSGGSGAAATQQLVGSLAATLNPPPEAEGAGLGGGTAPPPVPKTAAELAEATATRTLLMQALVPSDGIQAGSSDGAALASTLLAVTAVPAELSAEAVNAGLSIADALIPAMGGGGGGGGGASLSLTDAATVGDVVGNLLGAMAVGGGVGVAQMGVQAGEQVGTLVSKLGQALTDGGAVTSGEGLRTLDAGGTAFSLQVARQSPQAFDGLQAAQGAVVVPAGALQGSGVGAEVDLQVVQWGINPFVSARRLDTGGGQQRSLAAGTSQTSLNSQIQSVTFMDPKRGGKEVALSLEARGGEPFLVTLRSERDNADGVPVCAYWHTARKEWILDGEVVNSTNTTVTCAFTHLTDFAAMLAPRLPQFRSFDYSVLLSRRLLVESFFGSSVALGMFGLLILVLVLSYRRYFLNVTSPEDRSWRHVCHALCKVDRRRLVINSKTVSKLPFSETYVKTLMLEEQVHDRRVADIERSRWRMLRFLCLVKMRTEETCCALLCTYSGDPYTSAQRLLIAITTCFLALVFNVLSWRDQMDPMCAQICSDYNTSACEEVCRVYDCPTSAAELSCLQANGTVAVMNANVARYSVLTSVASSGKATDVQMDELAVLESALKGSIRHNATTVWAVCEQSGCVAWVDTNMLWNSIWVSLLTTPVVMVLNAIFTWLRKPLQTVLEDEKVLAIFYAVNTHGDPDTLGREDLQELGRLLGWKWSAEDLDDIMFVIDVDRTGEVTQEDFITWWNNTHGLVFEKRRRYVCCGPEVALRDREKVAELHRQHAQAAADRRARWKAQRDTEALEARQRTAADAQQEHVALVVQLSHLHEPAEPGDHASKHGRDGDSDDDDHDDHDHDGVVLPPGTREQERSALMKPIAGQQSQAAAENLRRRRSFKLPRSHIHTTTEAGELVVMRRSHLQACIPYIFVAVVATACVIIITAVTSTFDAAKTRRWLGIAAYAIGLKWIITDPLLVLALGPMYIMGMRGCRQGEWYRDRKVEDLWASANDKIAAGDFDRAAHLLQSALDMDPHNQKLLAEERMAELHAANIVRTAQLRADGERALQRGAAVDAMALFDAALAIQPDSEGLRAEEQQAYDMAQRQRTSQLAAVVSGKTDDARAALGRGELERAAQHLELARSLVQHTRSAAASAGWQEEFEALRRQIDGRMHQRRGGCLLLVKQYDQAAQAFALAIQAEPSLEPELRPRMEEVDALRREQAADQAALTATLEAGTNVGAQLKQQAQAALQTGQHAIAASHAELAVAVQGDQESNALLRHARQRVRAMHLSAEGDVHSAAGDHEAALACYARAKELMELCHLGGTGGHTGAFAHNCA
jgi:tetratricopeptide (TPR) repeat protein